MTRSGVRDGRIWPLFPLAAAAILFVFVIGQAIRHDYRRSDILSTAAQSPASAAAAIAERFGAGTAVCHPTGPTDDLDNLISALFALERFGVSPFETTAEALAVRVSGWLGLTPPDFSYGPGQIRLSRALSLAAVADDPAGWKTQVATASKLLEPCAARGVARRLIRQARHRRQGELDAEGALDHGELDRLAAIYNAQDAPTDGKAALAHHLFNRIAYHLTLHYRYENTPDGAASRDRR
ncbi:hypothetical protein [Dichotomicrobium thermohalophilum]|uniref:Uncharacterized protein n=1 Tax=Dichotomicrobium thermohalophilum TaxID=933063 RepID=A0A397Q1R8_9HYPH|nr:hypothetical protein [Dichotomicrobium thermohalophilum]RIA54998.1 hypothetical protein BXY53_0048 [Dichotomicrobium thermohalophilum]